MNNKLKERIKEYSLDLKRAGAFIFREYHLTRRYFTWFIVFLVYAVVNSATIVLIGVASGDPMQTLNLMLGVLLWSFLSSLFHEISNSITWERWEGTIEYTFMAPVSRLTHMLGISAFAAVYAIVRVIVILLVLTAFAQIDLSGANLWGAFVVLVVASLSFMGLGLMAAILPLLSPEKGAQATHIVQASLLLISGVYYSVDILPYWIQPLSVISPATYALNACRKLLGIGVEGSAPGALRALALSDVISELAILTVFGLIAIPFGLWLFNRAETWAKRTGKLKRSG